MEYFSIDIETTGIDKDQGVIIQFAAIYENTNNILPYEKIPKFQRLLEHKVYYGGAYAINMHTKLWAKLAGLERLDYAKVKEYKEEHSITTPDSLVNEFTTFVKQCNPDLIKFSKPNIQVAGKNAALFDIPWLMHHIPEWKEKVRIKQRVLDPAILFTNFKDDPSLPNLEQCKERAKLSDTHVSHDALDDAWDVIQILRTKY